MQKLYRKIRHHWKNILIFSIALSAYIVGFYNFSIRGILDILSLYTFLLGLVIAVTYRLNKVDFYIIFVLYIMLAFAGTIFGAILVYNYFYSHPKELFYKTIGYRVATQYGQSFFEYLRADYSLYITTVLFIIGLSISTIGFLGVFVGIVLFEIIYSSIGSKFIKN